MATFQQIKVYTLGLVLLVCACKAPTQVAHVSPEEDAKASSMFVDAENQLRNKQPEMAYKTFESIFTQYPSAKAADNALLRAAQIKASQKQYPQAIEFLEQLTHTYPKSDIIDQAFRDKAYVHFLEKDCAQTMNAIFQVTLENLQSKDQAKLSSKAQTCMKENPDQNFSLIWHMKKFETMKKSNPLYMDTKQKIIQGIEDRNTPSDEKFLVHITKKYNGNFPAGHASYQLIQMYQNQGQKRKVDKWSKYFHDTYPLHAKASKVHETQQTSQMDSRSNPHKIGVLLPMSGPKKHIGQLILNGLTLAIGTFDGQVGQNSFELIIEDTKSNPSVARQRIKKLIFTDEVIGVIGPISAKETQGVADIAASIGVPIITMTPRENITELGETVFRNSITKKEQAIALAQLTNQVLNIHRVAILYPETSYGQTFMEIFWKEFEKYGGRVFGAESFERKQTDYAQSIQKLVGLYPVSLRQKELCSRKYTEIWHAKKKKGQPLPNCFPKEELPPIIDFEAILIPDGHHRARQILPALKYHDVRGVQVLGTNLWNNKGLLEGTTSGELEGAIFLDSFFIDKKSPSTQAFVQKFYTHFGYEPSVLEAQAYDSLKFITDILQNKKVSSRSRLTQELYRKDDFQGVTGLSGFSAEREAVRNLTPLIVHQNKIVELH